MCRFRVLARALVAAVAVTWNLWAPPPAHAGRVDPMPPAPARAVSLAGFTTVSSPAPPALLADRPGEATVARGDATAARDGGASAADSINAASLPLIAGEHVIAWGAIAEEHADGTEVVQVDWAAVRAEAATDGPPLIPLPAGALSGLAGLGGLAVIGARRFRRWLS